MLKQDERDFIHEIIESWRRYGLSFLSNPPGGVSIHPRMTVDKEPTQFK